MLEAIRLLYSYNSWAMELLAAIDPLTEEQYNAPGCSGHGSIRDTLAHTIGVQRGWISWFDGSKTLEQVMAMRLTGEDVGAPERARALWKAVDTQTNEYVAKLTDAEIREIRTADSPRGKMSLPLWQLLLHVANHGTHTRAQMVSAIRRFERTPGNLDLLFFALQS
jgi:uncharacterized damage-inducible protein DinB